MAYESAKLNVLVPRVGQGGTAVWGMSGTDIHTAVDEADFITDGYDKGLRVNDVVLYTKETATVGTTVHAVLSVTVGGAATLAPAILA